MKDLKKQLSVFFIALLLTAFYTVIIILKEIHGIRLL